MDRSVATHVTDGVPQDLRQVTFVVVDTETTGASPYAHRLTEVAALKVRGGEVLGHFRSLVWGDDPIPGFIVSLTGIDDHMRRCAPFEADVIDAFRVFLGDAIIVGHNLRFDLGFLNAACTRGLGQSIDNHAVDTLLLARRLLRDEVDNFKLATLAHYLQLRSPSHRALADVVTTTALLHTLIERLGSLGIATLDDLQRWSAPRRARTTSQGRVPLIERTS